MMIPASSASPTSTRRLDRPAGSARPGRLRRQVAAWCAGFFSCVSLVQAGDPLPLAGQAEVDSEGVFLSQLVADSSTTPLPRIRVAEAPRFGRVLTLTRAQIVEQAEKAAPELVSTVWTGAERVRVTRRSRPLLEAELKEQITALLQREQVRDKGELELRLTRPWAPVLIPDEAYTVKILDLPTTGVSPNFILRFELDTAGETVGTWQASLQARVFREVWVARSALKRGTPFPEAEVARERRDVLGLRELLLPIAAPDATMEIAEGVVAGAPLYARSVRLRPVILRGQVVEALVNDGAMSISLKVEALENGSAGQWVRVRNVQSKREFRGKVQNEQTILVQL